MSAPARIALAQRQREQNVLAKIDRDGSVGYIGATLPWLNALKRLQAKGAIVFDKKVGGYIRAVVKS